MRKSAVLVVALVVPLAACGSSKQSQSSSAQPVATTSASGYALQRKPTLSDNQTCSIEVAASLDVELNDPTETGTLIGAIGAADGTNAGIFQLAVQELGVFAEARAQQGSTYAQSQTEKQIPIDCGNAQNPLLTTDQIDGLENVASPDDSNALGNISKYAPSN